MSGLPPLQRRIVPLHGTESQRALKVGVTDAHELVATTDQERFFVGTRHVAPVWHGEVADEAEMLDLNEDSPRGCWPMDKCKRTDTGSVWICIGDHGEDVGDWVELAGGGSVATNYFGDSSDGAVTISSNTTLTSDTGVDDTGVVVKNYTDLTINSGVSLTAAQRVKAMLLYVDGNLTVNGALHMDARGASGAALDLAIARALASALFLQEAATVTWVIPAAGAAGGAGGAAGAVAAGGAGGAASMGAGGAGGAGTAYVGGSGGGAGGYNGTGQPGSAGAGNGGAGGNAANAFVDNSAYAGGAGNPPGTGYKQGASSSISAAPGGGGGTLIVIVRGTVTVGASGRISADGSRGGNAVSTATRALGGGGAGGGIVMIRHGGTYTVTGGGVVRAAGGAGGTATGGSTSNSAGGAGGAGSVSVVRISAA